MGNEVSTTPDAETKKRVDQWLTGHYDEATKQAVREMAAHDPQELINAFYTTLSFGTGGMRGIMGIGSNRMNDYTVRAATQGLANYINKLDPKKEGHSIFIGYDSRHHSKEFAEESAKVLAGNGLKVLLMNNICPSPLVSFGCRYEKCTAAIMITASHNPPEYNGYKVYWDDGAQVLPPHDTGIVAEVNKITDPKMVKVADSLSNPLIQYVGEDVIDAYVREGGLLQLYPEENLTYGGTLKVIYTSLHGTGITVAPLMLKRWGFTNVVPVAKQIIPDGDFPTAHSPNPEEKAALSLGIQTMTADKGDILVANDPDADRVGVAVMHKGEAVLLTGNQMANLCLEHICEALTQKNIMPQNAAFVKTIATTEMFKTIAEHFHKPCFNVPVGFKYIAEKIREWEQSGAYKYLFGGEESYGYLLGTITRDKDGIIAAALICEVTLKAKREGKTLVDKLNEIYAKYGIYEEGLLSVKFPETKEGKQKIATKMAELRTRMPEQIHGSPVARVEDFLTSKEKEFPSGIEKPLTLAKTDTLLIWLADGSKIMIRPSGTEPKIKLYAGVVDKKSPVNDTTLQAAKDKVQSLLDAAKALFS